MFKEMEEAFKGQVFSLIQSINVENARPAPDVGGVNETTGTLITSHQEPSELGGPKDKVEGKKLGRNDPCWCGSGKKYKKCHGK